MLVAVSFVLLRYCVFAHSGPNQTPHSIAHALARFVCLAVSLSLCLALCGVISRGTGAIGRVAVYRAVGACGRSLPVH